MARRRKPAPEPEPVFLPGTEDHEHPVVVADGLASLLRPLDQIHPDPANPRVTRDVDFLVACFRRFGYTDPIVLKPDGMIEAGHQRYYALKKIGATAAPVVVTGHDGLTATAFNIAHNRSNEVVAAWDRDPLAAMVRQIHEEDAALAKELGWSDEELAAMLADADSDGDDEPSDDGGDDTIPDPPDEPTTKPGDVIQIGDHVLHCADCMDVLRSLPDNSIDSIVTDPPYGLSPDGRARTWDDIAALREHGKGPRAGFMGKEWDAGVPGVTWARECLRVLKPGGHIIAFASSRTIHRLTCAVEDAGFEIRDGIDWLYWQGFPKSLNVSKAIDAEAGAERKAIGTKKSGIAVPGEKQRHTIGGSKAVTVTVTAPAPATPEAKRWDGWGTGLKPAKEPAVLARKPCSEPTVAANVLRWGTGALNIDACRLTDDDPAWPGPRDERDVPASDARGVAYEGSADGSLRQAWHYDPKHGRFPANIYYCPKPAGAERNEGCDDLPERASGVGALRDGGRGKAATNVHPTVKPKKLWRWLLRLVTPPGGTCLETFCGSGTALVAARGLDLRIIAAEREPAYCDIIVARAGDP